MVVSYKQWSAGITNGHEWSVVVSSMVSIGQENSLVYSVVNSNNQFSVMVKSGQW